MTAVRPISASGWRIVVTAGVTMLACSTSSKPTTERSLGDLKSADASGLEDADREVVVEGEDRRWRIGKVEQGVGRSAASEHLPVGFELERGVGHDARCRERGVISAPALLRREPAVRPGDRRDAPVPELQEVLHRLVGAGGMRRRHRGDVPCERLEGVDDDEGVTLGEQLLELVVRLLGEDDQGAVGDAVEQTVEQRDLSVVLVARG